MPSMAPRHLLQEESWDSVHRSEASDEVSNDDEFLEEQHPLDMTSPTLPTVGDIQRLLHPLQATADRVGRQIEQFAENLDRLSTRNQTQQVDSESPNYASVIPAIQAYRQIATDTVKRLKATQTPRGRKLGEGSQPRSPSITNTNGTPSGRPAKSGVRIANDSNATPTDLRNWQREEQTWDLLETMVQVEYPAASQESSSTRTAAPTRPSSTTELHSYSAEKDVWQRFLASDDLAWERHVVIDWLQRSADRYSQDIEEILASSEDDAGRGSGIIAHSWLYTREAIKAQKRLRSWPRAFDPDDPGLDRSLTTSSRDAALVTQLDPDAVTRQGRSLEKPDISFERSLWLACWELLRRGKPWSYVREWCAERAEAWRSASMNGSLHLAQSQHSADWRSTQLWRRACAVVAKEGGMNEYERAVFGLFSGYLPSTLNICSTWADQVFAYYSSYQIHSFERFVRRTTLRSATEPGSEENRVLNVAPHAGQRALSGNQLIEKLKLSEETTQEALEPFITLQGSLIARNFDDFVFKHGVRLCQTANAGEPSRVLNPMSEELLEGEKTAFIDLESYDFLRVVTHMIFIFQDLGHDFGSGDKLQATESIIVAYIEFLARAGKMQLLPLYASRLSPERSVTSLGRQLPFVQEQEREKMMKIMKIMEIDIPEALKTQLKIIIQASPPAHVHTTEYPNLLILEENEDSAMRIPAVAADFIGDVISEDHLDLIHGFEWYKLVDDFWPQTMALGVMVYKYLLRCKALAAGIYMSQKIPFAEIAVTKTPAILGQVVHLTDEVHLDEEVTNGPLSPTSNVRPRASDGKHGRRSRASWDKDRAALMLQQSRSFRDLENLFILLRAMEEWRKAAINMQEVSQRTNGKSLRELIKPLKETFHSVEAAVRPLLWGWLRHPTFDREADEFLQIRLSCLPEVVLAYNSIINFSSRYVGRGILELSMDLAAAVATEGSDVGAAFVQTGRMPELVDSFSVIAKSMITADAKKAAKKKRDGKTLALFSAKAPYVHE